MLELREIVDRLRKLWIPGEPLPPPEEFSNVDLGRRNLLKLIGVGAAVAVAAPLTKAFFPPQAIEFFNVEGQELFPFYEEGLSLPSAMCAFQLEKVRDMIPNIIERDEAFYRMMQMPERMQMSYRKFRISATGLLVPATE